MPTSKEIRQTFIDFFQERGHSYVHSSPVIPEGDPTLLFANAGMNQFKNIFLGQKEAEVKRAVNSQKCIRAGGKHNDLEQVGKDGYHHTFFEMLGNWSFGDYYKKEAILWAWELLTEVWKLPKDKLYATVHDSDQEAFELWRSQTDIDPAHISFQGDKDNFWEMGDTGPCGPCSEIHIDRGPEHCSQKGEIGHVCEICGDCGRYIELWNLVFIQYNREADRSLTPLKDKFVDTGAGFERLVQVLQGKNSNYETDLFLPIIERVAELSGVAYSPENGTSHRVIADHVRCLCFALADGGFPSNEGRGYVLRRILRRAARHGRLLGFAEPFIFHLVDPVIASMGHHFPELAGKESYIRMVIKAEEERFNATLDKGLEQFDQIRAQLQGDLIPGKDAFMLYDTYGFPLDLTLILAAEQNLRVDTAGFEKEMAAQRARARESSRFAYVGDSADWIELEPSTPTVFLGYDEFSAPARIQRYRVGEEGLLQLQLDRTPFYAESGGQLADTGRIFNAGFELSVSQVVKNGEHHIHIGKLTRGSVNADPVTAEIDLPRRRDIMRNHTATHLLHKALRGVLGEHVQQKGSLVGPEHLRFDFTHMRALTRAELDAIENTVNAAIRDNRTVSVQIKDIDTARAEGAIALFGEKYAAQVRVVSVSGFSQELCGGTHVSASGEIGLFKIVSESSSAAGIRRIEALTGRAAEQFVLDLQRQLGRLAEKLQVPEKMLESKVETLQNRVQELDQQLKQVDAQQAGAEAAELLRGIQDLGDFQLLAAKREADAAKLRELGDSIKDKAPGAVALLFSVLDNKVTVLCVVGETLRPRFNAGNVVKTVSARLEGKGGGRPDSAMGGGTRPDLLDEVIEQLPQIIRAAAEK
ncbi:MAG: alanine--tRNA ligase [Candidatus Cloacimonetes bacterium]|nr:alanine--tRNA ligase [Candidatus Cloacimonadota bacterium]